MELRRLAGSLACALMCAVGVASCSEEEPCIGPTPTSVSADATPFSDGRSAFELCAECPPYPYGDENPPDGMAAKGSAATQCELISNDAFSDLYCQYGPGGGGSGKIEGPRQPSQREFCRQYCPDDYFHGCSFGIGEGYGISYFFCNYGQSCPE